MILIWSVQVWMCEHVKQSFSNLNNSYFNNKKIKVTIDQNSYMLLFWSSNEIDVHSWFRSITRDRLEIAFKCIFFHSLKRVKIVEIEMNSRFASSLVTRLLKMWIQKSANSFIYMKTAYESSRTIKNNWWKQLASS